MARRLLTSLSIMSRGLSAFEMTAGDEAIELARLLEPDADEDILPTQVTPRRPRELSSVASMRSDLASLPEVNFHYVVARQPRIADPVSSVPHHTDHHTPFGFQIAAPSPGPAPSLRGEISVAKRELADIFRALSDPRSPTSVSHLYDRATASWRLWEWNASDIAWAALLGTVVFALAASIGVGVVGRSDNERATAALDAKETKSSQHAVSGRVPRTLDQHTGRAPIRVRAKRR